LGPKIFKPVNPRYFNESTIAYFLKALIPYPSPSLGRRETYSIYPQFYIFVFLPSPASRGRAIPLSGMG
jgi:hypothetical protein